MLLIGLISILLAIALYSFKITPILLIRLTSILLLYSAALSYNTLYVQPIGSGIGIYSNLCNITVISQYFDIILFIIGSLILLPWGNFNLFKQYKDYGSVLPTILEYPLIILFSLIGSTFLISSADLISMYLSIELQSFGVYILATLYRNSESSTYAGLKYFLLGGLSSAFILLGSAFIYASTGVTNFINIYSIACINNNINLDLFWSIDKGIILGMIIITFGLLFKIAGAPFHNWAPDVYDGVPTIITTWLIIMPKLSILIFFIELINGYGFISLNIYNIWFNLILISALLSLLIGTIVGLSQYRIKRLLSYSTISHIGFMLLALGIYSEQSIESFLFYLIQYSLTSLNIFCILLAFGYSIIYNDLYNINKDIKFISQLKGQFIFNPLLALSFAICLFSMAGVPPLIGFFAKQMVLYSSIQHGYYFLSIIAIIASVISAAYYLKVIKVIHFDYDNNNNTTLYYNINYLSTSHSFIIAIMTLFILLFVLKPNLILNSIHIMTLSLFYY